MSREPRTLTPSELERIEAMGKAGVPFTTVARRIRAHRETLIAALDRQGCGHWMALYFTKKQGQGSGGGSKSKMDGDIRKLKPEQIKAPLEIPDNAQTRWLTKSWRKAA